MFYLGLLPSDRRDRWARGAGVTSMVVGQVGGVTGGAGIEGGEGLRRGVLNEGNFIPKANEFS